MADLKGNATPVETGKGINTDNGLTCKSVSDVVKCVKPNSTSGVNN